MGGQIKQLSVHTTYHTKSKQASNGLPLSPRAILSLITKSWLILTLQTAEIDGLEYRIRDLIKLFASQDNVELLSKVLTQYCLHQTNLWSSIFLKVVSTEVKIGVSEDGALETFIASVFRVDNECDDGVVMMFPCCPFIFGQFDC